MEEHRACLPGMWQSPSATAHRQKGNGLEMQWGGSGLDLGSFHGARLRNGDMMRGGHGEAKGQCDSFFSGQSQRPGWQHWPSPAWKNGKLRCFLEIIKNKRTQSEIDTV